MATTSSGQVTTTTVNGVQRITGLASGVDVDSIVKKIIDADKGKLNKLQQQQQNDQWIQEQYRTIITDIQSFSSKYCDLLSANNLLSQSNLRKFQVTSDNSAISAVAGSTAVPGNHTISVSHLATAATMANATGITKGIQGTTAPNYTAAQGGSFTISLDGTDRTVTIDSSVTNLASLQAAVDKAVGAGKINLDDSSGVLTVAAVTGSGVQSITVSNQTGGALSALGFGSGGQILSNRLNTSDTLQTVAGKLNNPFSFNGDGQLAFSINGEKFTFDKDDTLQSMIDKINSDDKAGVTMKYDSINDKLVMTATQTGAGTTITTSDTGGNFLATVMGSVTAGTDAKLIIDGQSLTRSSNAVTLDGVTYTLNKATAGDVNVGITQDVDGIYKTITDFVDGYNKLIKEINDKLSEKHDKDYPPLTDDQKSEMTEDQITKWNDKAKTGLLTNDSLLSGFVSDLRSALVSSVSGVNSNLAKIGITTVDYTENGQLHVDETKLKQAIRDDPTGVMNLFSQQSTSYPGTMTVRSLTSSQLSTRYKEEGMAYRVYDILQKYVSTYRDSSNQKGLMLEKVGIAGDTTNTKNVLTKELTSLADKIKQEQSRLDDEQDRYYRQFTNMEQAISKLSSQASILSSAFSNS